VRAFHPSPLNIPPSYVNTCLAIPEFLSFVIPRLYFITDGRQAGLESIRGLVDDRILRKEEQAFHQMASQMQEQKVTWQAQTVRLLPGTPDAPAFAISTRFAKVRCMVEGRSVLIGTGLNRTEVVRWDCDLDMVAVSDRNAWGLRLAKIHVSGMDAPPVEISDLYYNK
jgi:hypothetical protein